MPVEQAPLPPTRMDEEARHIAEAIQRLTDREVLRLEPEVDETLESLKMAVEHVALTRGMCVNSWTDDDFLYVRRTSQA
jgi:hypothetical protein